MRERLIELLNEEVISLSLKDCDLFWTHNQIGELADRLLAEGVIVPPCKVGDTVYVVSQGAGFSVIWSVYRAKARAIHLDKYGKLFIGVETDRENVGGYVEVERVFLSIEEAEKTLEKMQGGE